MLKIHRTFRGKTAQDAEKGNANELLQRILIEVVTENYRQMMFEYQALEPEFKQDALTLLDPPLRANEKVISGLFSNAIARIAPRSRPEARIDRSEILIASEMANKEDDFSDGNPPKKIKHGRVDYLAWYSNRVFAIELKSAPMNCENPKATEAIKNRWRDVTQQTKGVQKHLKNLVSSDRSRYPSPISIGIMVIVGRRSINRKSESISAVSEDKFIQILVDELKGIQMPSFQATYTFPENINKLIPRKKGRPDPKNQRLIYTPYIAFLGYSSVSPGSGPTSKK